MLLREVEYARPTSVEAAIRLLAEHANARPLAGGQSLINVMKVRIASPDVVVDLNGIDALRQIRQDGDGGLELGAMVTYSELMLSPDVARACPILPEVAS